MNAIWKCWLCGQTIKEKNVSDFTILHVSYDPEYLVRGDFMSNYHGVRSKKCDRHKEVVYMELKKSN